MLYLDTETCGLHGPTVLIQYSFSDEIDSPVTLHEVWHETIHDTLKLIESFTQETVCGFNLSFDWFHLCQTYTTLLLLKDKVGCDEKPIDHIDAYVECEKLGRDGPCLKPKSALDLMLHAQKGEYQAMMDRKPIVIRRVPNELARPLVDLLDATIEVPWIYFAKKKKQPKTHWTIKNVDTDFSDVQLEFKPSTKLKHLAQQVFGYKPQMYADIAIPAKMQPIDVGWAPFALALSTKVKKWKAKKKKGQGWVEGYAWPAVIEYHINHWRHFKPARTYAEDDVILLKKFYQHFERPEAGDKDSILACMVGAVRWRGYAIDIPGLEKIRKQYMYVANSAPRTPAKVLLAVLPHLSAAEREKLRNEHTGRLSTKKVLLEGMAKWKKPCPHCISQISVMAMLHKEEQHTDCEHCHGTQETNEAHPVAAVAKACLDARVGLYKVGICDKLLQAGRFHASFNVIGALSARMSGADGLNAQGIDHTKAFRKLFSFAFGDLVPLGGDFSAFEVSIADAICDDQKLRDSLRTCAECKGLWSLEDFALGVKCPHCGKVDDEGKPCRQKFHGIFGQALAPGKSYDEILVTKGQSPDLYDQGKRGGFSQFYGGNYGTLMRRLGISEEVAREAEEYFNSEYAGVARFRETIKDLYCSMQQPDGLGTKVFRHEPKEYVESLTGHRRYFTLETKITKALFTLSTKIPDNWKQLDKLVIRKRDKGPQKLYGAVMSALIAAAFGIQSGVMRAAANHVIQSTGAELTKMLQVRLWNLQPFGVHAWRIQPMNVHDEIMCPALRELFDEVRQIIKEFISEYSKLIPLLAIDWSYDMKTWADK